MRLALISLLMAAGCGRAPAAPTHPVRPTPDFIYVRLLCSNAGADCPAKAWKDWLDARGEKLLSAPSGGRAYRFVWARSFHPNLILRLDVNAAGAGTLTSQWLTSHGGLMGPAMEAHVSSANVVDFERVLASNGFERMPAEPPKDTDSVCMDGSDWLVEAAGPKGYRFVHQNCAPDDSLQAIGMAMLDLARSRWPGRDYEPIY